MKKIAVSDSAARSTDAIADNLARMKALFPEAFADGKVDFGVIRQLLGDAVDEREEKYGLNWHGKRQSRQLALTPSTSTLRPCPEDSVDWDTTQNLVIEGDNLEVLKLLQKTYAGKVKLIYIDPPYNTGKDFVYPDDYRDSIRNYLELTCQIDSEKVRLSTNTETSGRFHTDWLNMMYPRLRLARLLLREDGFIFVTIDDAEVHNVRQILNEVFGEENFVANVIWEKKYTRANDAQFFSDNHDHILCFARNREISKFAMLPRSDDQLAAYKNPDNHPKGPWKATPLHAKSGIKTSPYTFVNGQTWSPPPGTFRRYSDDTMRQMDIDHEIWFGPEGNSTPARKSFLADVKPGVTPVTIWQHQEVGHNHEANNEIKEFLGTGVFQNPKPTRLIRRMIELSCSSHEDPDLVLDFFSGSGTSAHAVMMNNAADNGRRRFIMVQFPEPIDRSRPNGAVAADFCDSIRRPRNVAELTKERLRRAGSKIKDDKPMFAADIGFRVFKLDTSNIRAWDPDFDNLEATLLENVEHIKPDRSEDDILYELLLKLGLDLCVPIETRTIANKTVRSVGAGTLITCLAEVIGDDEVEPLAFGIADWHAELEPAGDATVVFRDSAFANDVAKTNVTAILEQRGLGNVRSL